MCVCGGGDLKSSDDTINMETSFVMGQLLHVMSIVLIIISRWRHHVLSQWNWENGGAYCLWASYLNRTFVSQNTPLKLQSCETFVVLVWPTPNLYAAKFQKNSTISYDTCEPTTQPNRQTGRQREKRTNALDYWNINHPKSSGIRWQIHYRDIPKSSVFSSLLWKAVI